MSKPCSNLKYEMVEDEEIYQDGELNRKQARDNLKRLFREGRISSITYNYYINGYNWED